MKKVIIISVLVILLVCLAIFSYNSLVTKAESVDTAYADVEVVLERRADLIPNLVSTVKGYAAHEESIISQITEARSKLMGANTVQEAADANEELSAALRNLMVIVENYPDLKASQNFISLQDELAGTENRIATARRDYNDAVRDYNTTIKRFPMNVTAGMFGFQIKTYFEAKEGSNEVPDVEF